MAKWSFEKCKTPDHPAWLGSLRAVNYFDGTHRPKDASGNEGPETPVIKHRLEQLGPQGWQPIPVYQEGADGTLTEIPQ